MPSKWDAIIVGSGAGGGTAAHVLTKRGWNVLVLERGHPKSAEDFLPFDELHFWGHKSLIPRVTDDPIVYIDPKGNRVMSERWWEINAAGGSTMVWDANFPRYTDEDFAVTRYMKDIPGSEHMVDWPWTCDEFIPYFEKAEWDWCVSGDAERSEERMRPGYRYPMPALKPHASTKFLTSIFTQAQLKPYLGARAINSETYDSRPACPFCGYCQLFGCAVNCRSNSVNTVLRRAKATGRCDLRTSHYVTRLGFELGKNGGPGRIRGVYYLTEPRGTEKFAEAPRVFVSVQTIQSARLFLLSEIPDPNKLVGHFLTYHTKGEGHFTFKAQPVWDKGPAYQPRTAIGSLQLRGLYTYKDKDGVLRKGGKFSVYDPFTCIPPLHLIKAASLSKTDTNVWGRQLVEYLHELRSQGGVSVSFTGEALSKYDNRVELDDQVKDPWGIPVARTYYQHDKWDQDLSRFALNKIADAVSNGGGELRRYEPQGEANPGYGHVHGALRAGLDPSHSVLDGSCQSHTVKGLYVLDAAFMPTAGASNPSITLIANAYRVCEQVAKE
jgi:choline dehydrogenase-like flavoprotein